LGGIHRIAAGRPLPRGQCAIPVKTRNRLERIIDIALDAGFENPESFSRALKNTFGQTPSAFRKNPAWQPWNEQYKFPSRQRMQNMGVKIVDFEQTRIAAFPHRGAPELVNDSVPVFIEWRKQSGLSPVKSSRTFGIAYDNPDTTEPEKFRFDICGDGINLKNSVSQ
jgi:AraC family transcriptional regulator